MKPDGGFKPYPNEPEHIKRARAVPKESTWESRQRFNQLEK